MMGLAAGQRSSDSRSRLALCAGMLVTTLLVASDAAAAGSRIYRTVDENGNVVFTDVPPRPDQPGQSVELNEGNSFTPPPAPQPAGEPSRTSVEQWLGNEESPAPGEDQAAALSYESLEIVSPGNDEAVRENAGNVSVTTRVQPALATGHVMQLLLDGQLAQSGQTTSFQLASLDRGTHSVQVRVVDASGNTLIASEPSVFHLQRRSVILQPNNRAR